MSSRGSPNPWPPYPGYRDCSQGICSIYCPQWCYIIFPPPPPSFSPEDDDSGSNFSPLIIAVIGILSSAFLLIAYYTLISKYCKRRRTQNLISDIESAQGQVNHDNFQATNQSGLEESIIKSITVCKYKVGDGLVEGTECSVCLSDFVENESLRLLPKCNHAFHLPCIDTWLKSHSNCPMCRANVAISSDESPSDQVRQVLSDRSALSISSLQVHRQHDLVVVEQRDEVVVDIIRDQNDQIQQEMRRSSSTDSFQRQQQLCVADILGIDDEEEEVVRTIVLPRGIGSSRGGNESLEMKRSVSTGKL